MEVRASTRTDLSVAEVITLVAGRAVGVDGGNEYAVVEAGRNESIVVR